MPDTPTDNKGGWGVVIAAVGGVAALLALVYAWSKGLIGIPIVTGEPPPGDVTYPPPPGDITPPGDTGAFNPDKVDDEGEGGLVMKDCPDGSRVPVSQDCANKYDGPMDVEPTSFVQGEKTTFKILVAGQTPPRKTRFDFCQGRDCFPMYTDTNGQVTLFMNFSDDVTVKGVSAIVRGRSVVLTHQPPRILTVGPSNNYDSTKAYNDFYLKCSGRWLAGGTDLNIYDSGTKKNYAKTLGSKVGAQRLGHADWENVFVIDGTFFKGPLVITPTEGPAKGMTVDINRLK